MNYYIGNIYYSDELYHHGIKGQRWGVRRFQNPDGTLTSEGKARYGDAKGFGPHNAKAGGFIRRVVTGDHVLGYERHRLNREKRLERKVDKLKNKGASENKIKKAERKYNAQKSKNIDIERYLSNTSTGKVFLQNYLLGLGSDSYRAARARGTSRGKSFLEIMLPNINLNPMNMESILARKRDRYKYGDIAHSIK